MIGAVDWSELFCFKSNQLELGYIQVECRVRSVWKETNGLVRINVDNSKMRRHLQKFPRNSESDETLLLEKWKIMTIRQSNKDENLYQSFIKILSYLMLDILFIKLDLAHRKTDANCIHRKDNAPKPLGPIISKL